MSASSARRWPRLSPRRGDAGRDALDAILVEYDELPVVTDPAGGDRDGAPLVWPAATGNIAAQMKHGDAAASDAAFAKAAHVVTLDLVNQRLVPASMEPRGALASSTRQPTA